MQLIKYRYANIQDYKYMRHLERVKQSSNVSIVAQVSAGIKDWCVPDAETHIFAVY